MTIQDLLKTVTFGTNVDGDRWASANYGLLQSIASEIAKMLPSTWWSTHLESLAPALGLKSLRMWSDDRSVGVVVVSATGCKGVFSRFMGGEDRLVIVAGALCDLASKGG